MESAKSIISICIQNIRKWNKNYNIWIAAVMLFTMLNIYIDDLQKLSHQLSGNVSLWIFPFLCDQEYMKVIFTIPLMLIFCNAPFIDNNQLYVCLRAGKTKWLTGQILYVIAVSIIYYLFLMFLSVLLVALRCNATTEWGNMLYTLAEGGSSEIENYPFLLVSDRVLKCFYPVQAIGYTFLLCCSNAILLGIMTFTANYLTKIKFSGIAISGFLIIFSFFVERCGYPKLIYISPVSWISLSKIDIGNTTQYPSFYYCVIFYWTATLLLILCICLFGRKSSVTVER